MNILMVKTEGITRMISILEIAYRKLFSSEEVYIRKESSGTEKIVKEGSVTVQLNVVNRNGDTIKPIKIEADLNTGFLPTFSKVPTSYHELEWVAYIHAPDDSKDLFPISESIEDIFNRDVNDYRKEDKRLVHMEWISVNIPLYTHYLMQRVAKKID